MTQDIENKENIKEPKAASWGQDRRLQFIDFRLRWDGKVNRTDLTEYFGISVPQASLDIAKYMELAPDNTEYDKSSKTYPIGPKFRPLYQRSSAERYLSELLATKAGVIERSGSFIGTAPEMDWPTSPERAVNEAVVETVVRAIRDRRTVEVKYQSMSSPEPSFRVLSPLALGNDGFRWHVRAYCHKREHFGDFLFARILSIKIGDPTSVSLSDDIAWQTILPVVLIPHPDLPPASKRAIEVDYGMKNGQVILNCRQALLFYMYRRLSLNSPDPSDPVSLQIVLKNREELQPYVDAMNSKS